jgi:ADP-ribose pyrophosphatase YjhB (NUDIX family)
MWASLPTVAQEYIYERNLPLKIAHIDESFDLPEREIRVAGIAQRDGETLFIRSCRDGRDWEFPGGRMEDGEMPDDTIRREFTEETGLDVSSVEPLIALVWAVRDSTIVQLVFYVEAGGEVCDPDETEVCDIAWFGSLPEEISFGAAGHETYQFIIDSTPVTVAFEDGERPPFDIDFSNRKSLAVGGAVAGGAIVAGLARRLFTGEDE